MVKIPNPKKRKARPERPAGRQAGEQLPDKFLWKEGDIDIIKKDDYEKSKKGAKK